MRITTHVFISVDIFLHYGTKGSYVLMLLYLFGLLPRRLMGRTKESTLKGKKKKRGKENEGGREEHYCLVTF